MIAFFGNSPFQAKAYTNTTVKKIPQMLLEKCEFGKTCYSLNTVHNPDEKDKKVLGISNKRQNVI